MKRYVVGLLLFAFVLSLAACSQRAKGRHPISHAAREIDRVYFDFNKSTLSGDEKKKLSSTIRHLKSHPNWIGQVEGHTDAIGSKGYNLRLGDRRARTVKEVMVLEGVSPAQLIILSFGEDRSIADNNTDEGRAKNRRVEVKVR